METLVEAVNESALIVVCLSKSYKRDNHCQAITKYAFHSKHRILPLIVKKGYKIDGWLKSIVDKQNTIQIDSNDFKTNCSLLLEEISKNLKTKVSDIKSNVAAPMNVEEFIRSSNSLLNDQQQKKTTESIKSTPTITTTQSPVPVDKQQKLPVRSNSRPTTPGTVPFVSIFSLVNTNERIHIPEEYIKRDTSKSTYHTTPLYNWKRKDILDFLYDANLNIMMPLCESMTGRALIHFFRMCQAKPNRLHSKLNEELRSRFKGLTLPMGVYTQFLIEIDTLLESVADIVPSLSSRPSSSNVEHNVHVPDIVQPRSSSMQSSHRSSVRSTLSPVEFQTFRPIEKIFEASVPHRARTTERTIFRPASAASHPFDFVVESGEEPTVILQQVERYAPQILLLEQKARELREARDFR